MPLPPPILPAPVNAPVIPPRARTTMKLLLIAGLVVLLQIPLLLVNMLRHDRMRYRDVSEASLEAAGTGARARESVLLTPRPGPAAGGDVAAPLDPRVAAAEGYRMVERALKHGVLVLALVFAAFFLFEILSGLRLHTAHYLLVGAALCLFYLALLALGEVMEPGPAYIGAALASSLLITLYSAAILRSRGRAAIIAGLLAAVYGALYVVLRLEDFALLAGTAALFAALAAVMYFTRNIDWGARDSLTAPAQ